MVSAVYIKPDSYGIKVFKMRSSERCSKFHSKSI